DINKIGNGRLIIGGSASYAGTTVSAGTLQIGNGATTGNLGTGNVTLSGNLDFNRSDNLTVTNDISGSGGIWNSGAGQTTPMSIGNFQGTVGVNNGTLLLQGTSFPQFFIVNGNGVLRVATDQMSGQVSSVTVNSNATQTGALELSDNVSNPFNNQTVSFAGRTNATSGIRSTNGTNSLPGNISLAT